MNLVLSAFTFPLKKSSLVMLCCLITLELLIGIVAHAPMLIGTIIGLGLSGYICATYFQIIYTTGNGHEEAPRFPEFSNIFDNMLVPLLKVFLITLLSFLPLGLYYALADDNANEGIALALTLLGYFYLPMGMMIAALDEVGKALNPAVILQAIRAIGATYFIMVGALFGFYIMEVMLENAFSGAWILTAILSSYGLMFSGRLIGAVYREKITA